MPACVSLRALAAVLLSALALTVAAGLPPLADGAAAATGCVSNAEYRRLAQGQRLHYIRRVAGDDAQISMRRWTQSGTRYQQRLYAMCTPWDADHDTLTTRFKVYQGAWRAFLVDTRVGPEE
jgi:hypothetical protein